MNRIPRSKRVIYYTITIGLTIAICFTILEYGMAKYYHSTENEISYTEFDPIIGWRLRPGSHWVKPSHTFSKHRIYVNEYGLRDPRAPAAAKKNAKRIMILGDSFTFATAIRDENTFAVRLEKLLNRGGDYDVINAGVPGYGTAQEMLLMRDLAAKNVVADVYVLVIFINDILDNLRLSEYGTLSASRVQPGFLLEPDGKLVLAYYPVKQYSTNFVAPKKTGSFTLEVIRTRTVAFLQTRPSWVGALNKLGLEAKLPRMPGLIHGWYPEEVLASGVPLTRALIKEIRETAKGKHALLLASLVPSPIQVYPDVYGPILRNTFPNNILVERYFNDPTRPQRIISEICRELEIPFVDLLPILLQNNVKELFIPGDGHFTNDGHAIVAQQLTTFINAHSASR